MAADPDSPARSLFKEGRELAAAGNYQAACPKFEQSLALEVGLGTQFNLADCWEHIGRNASAHALFLGAAASAKAAGQLDREQVLRDRAAALEPRISKLVVEVSSDDPKLVVKRDELPIEPEKWGRGMPIDAGKYVISAKAPHKQAFSETVEIKPGQAVATVVIPELKSDEPEPVVAPVPVKEASPQPVVPPSTSDRDRQITYKSVSLGVLGVGALTLGTVMGLRYKSSNDAAKEVCPSGRGCSEGEILEHQRLVDRASLSRTVSYIGFGGGAACLAGAASAAAPLVSRVRWPSTFSTSRSRRAPPRFRRFRCWVPPASTAEWSAARSEERA
jgi:hypothetical protein